MDPHVSFGTNGTLHPLPDTTFPFIWDGHCARFDHQRLVSPSLKPVSCVSEHVNHYNMTD